MRMPYHLCSKEGIKIDRNSLLNDSETAQRIALDGRQSQIWTTMPAIVTSVNWGEMTLECQPAVQGEQDNGDGTSTFVSLPLLVDCPIVFPAGGGFILTMPIKAGDEVKISIASRCINSWWQNGGTGNIPEEFRMHDLSDGFAECGPKSLPNVVGNISSENVQLRSNDGTCYLEITPDGKINFTAPGGMNFTAPLATFSGDVVAGPDLISLITHIHTGGTIPPGNTGEPIP